MVLFYVILFGCVNVFVCMCVCLYLCVFNWCVYFDRAGGGGCL